MRIVLDSLTAAAATELAVSSSSDGLGDDVNIVTARREILTSSCAQGDVAPAGYVAVKRCPTVGRVEVAGYALSKRKHTDGRVAAAVVVCERKSSVGRVVAAGCVGSKR